MQFNNFLMRINKNYFLIEFCFEIIVLSEGNTCIAQPNLEVLPFVIINLLYYNNNLVQYIKGKPVRKMFIRQQQQQGQKGKTNIVLVKFGNHQASI